MIISIALLLQLGWLLVELHFTKQSLAEEYSKIRNGIEQEQKIGDPISDSSNKMFKTKF